MDRYEVEEPKYSKTEFNDRNSVYDNNTFRANVQTSGFNPQLDETVVHTHVHHQNP
jgi:hypothetical protein